MSLYDGYLSTHRMQPTAEIVLLMWTLNHLGTDVKLLKCILK